MCPVNKLNDYNSDHKWPRNQWFLLLNKLILYIIFLLQLPETIHIVISNLLSRYSRISSGDVRVVFNTRATVKGILCSRFIYLKGKNN